MEWLRPATHGESVALPVEDMGFDVLRAIAQSRQSATPTVRALAHALLDHRLGDESEQRMRLFMGHIDAIPQRCGGTFARLHAEGDASDQPCSDEGECHA